MSNETIRKRWYDLLNSFEELLKTTELDKDCYSVKFFQEENKLMKYYEKKLLKKKINFNQVKAKTTFDLNFEKLDKDNLTLTFPEYNDKTERYHEMLKSFFWKIKDISHSVISGSLFQEEWENFYDLLDIVKSVARIDFNNPIFNKVMFKELYSILDRIAIEFCEKKSSSIIKDMRLEKKIYNDPYFNIFYNFIKIKSNKNKIIIFKNYSESNQEIAWEIKNNDILNKFNNNWLWKVIINVRNNLEHSMPTIYIKDAQNQNQILNFMFILIGLNFYLLSKFDSILI